MENNAIVNQKIAILGGTGKEGKGLAYRWGKAGLQVVIGSRTIEKAQEAADELNVLTEASLPIQAALNSAAAKTCDIVVITVPFSAHKTLLEEVKPFLKGKLLIDVSVPLVPPKVTKVQMPPAGSALQDAKALLGNDVFVASAFHNIAHENLLTDKPIECDVLVCGETREVRDIVLELVNACGLKGWDAGPIENSVVLEGLTSVLIGINKRYGSTSAGIKITGIPEKG